MADIELNKLGVKSDSLPNDWLVTLVNPKIGTTAENMTIAKFVEFLLENNNVLTKSDEGLEGELKSNASYYLLHRSRILDLNSIQVKGIRGLSIYNYQAQDLNIPVGSDNSSILFHIDRGIHGGYSYFSQLAFQSNGIFFREYHNEVDFGWKKLAFKEDISLSATGANALTKTIVEDVPVSTNIPMTLQEDGQLEPMTQKAERYEYSIQKMAEAILELQKQVAEMKS